MKWWMALCLALGGCDGLGRAVVGERTLGQIDEVCADPLPCEPIEIDEPESLPTAALPVDLRECNEACVARAASSDCVAAESGVERELACAHVRLEPGAVERVEIGSWTWVAMEVESEGHAIVEISAGMLEHVSITLRGPITLRITDAPRVRDLRVLAPVERAQIELQRVAATVLAIEAPEAEVLLRRSDVARATLDVERLGIESSKIADASWRAASLTMSDATVERVQSDAARSVLSASSVRASRFSGCQSLTAVQAQLEDVHMQACAEEAGLYGATLLHAQLEGNLILDGAGLDNSVLGIGEVGTIKAWDTRLKSISFCADQHVLSLAGGSSLRCGRCDLTPEPAVPAVCQLPHSQSAVENSASCPALVDVIPECSDPLPERMRPPRH